MAVTRTQMRFSIRKHAFSETAGPDGHGEQLMQETGHLSTPTAAPSGDEVAYLSDNGGHANLWVTSAKGPPRRITSENDPDVAVGAPVWSPDGRWIAFVYSKGNVGLVFGIWLVKPDGSELHQIVPKGLGAGWSDDGRWLYYVESASSPIKRIAVDGGTPEPVRPEAARSVIGAYGSTVYFVVERALMDGRPQFELHAAQAGDGPSRRIKTIPASQVPTSWQVVNPALSPNGKWMAMPLTDGFTTNVWAISTEDGRSRQVTDFGDRAVFIARRVSWSADGRSIFAAVGEGDSDIFLLDGLFRSTVR
jgi:Tol biopolymer transport system component